MAEEMTNKENKTTRYSIEQFMNSETLAGVSLSHNDQSVLYASEYLMHIKFLPRKANQNG